MKRIIRSYFWAALLVAAMALVLSARVAGAAVSGGKLIASPTENQLTIRLQLACGSNDVTYVVQSSTNMIEWKTILAVKPQAGKTLSLGSFPTTNQAALFRLVEVSAADDSSAPVWSNGVQGKFIVTPPAGIIASWLPAADEVGVAEYRLYVNGVLITNVLGTVLSQDLAINLRERAEIRIQAVDASDNVSDLLILTYLPGDKLLAVSDDGGRVYTSFIQTNGTFSAFRQIANYSSNDRGLCLADFDRDGLTDLVAGYASGNTLVPFFYKGLGDGSFASAVALPTVTGTSSYVMDGTAADFDADGNLDFLLNGNERFAMFYWGNGDGSFATQVRDWGNGSYYYGRGTAAGDFNEDGREDLARATCCNGMVKVFLSNGDRTFVETNLIAQALGNNDPYGLAAGDFDEDGHLDLLVAGGSSGDVSFLKGFGNGSFTNITSTNGLWLNVDVNTHSGMDAFDYDGDNHLDLVMAAANGQAYFWRGIGDGAFDTNRTTLATGMSAAFGVSAPPRPPRVVVNFAPLDPITNLNGTLTFTAQGNDVTSGDFFRWTFGDTSTNPYAWTFTDDMTNMGAVISHTFTNEGRFLTRLLHTTTNGILSSRGTWVTVYAEAPVANPGGPYVLGELAATQNVWTATLDGAMSTDDFGIVKYLWHFGDGTSVTNSGPAVSHGWNGPGPWTVGLTVTDASGLSSSNFTTVTFNPGDFPVAVISGPAVVDETNAVNGVWSVAFNGALSTDDVGIWKYDWRFGNGQTASGRNVTTTYDAVGDYIVTLTVTDHANQTNATTHTVTIKANQPPVPKITGATFLTEAVATNGLWFGAWNGSASTDDRGIYRYDWRFGDGGTATGAGVTHQYAGTGVYPLVLTVTDFGNQSVSVTQNVIVVAGDFPVARITTSGSLPPEGAQPVNLSGITSTDDHRIMSYRWLLPEELNSFDGVTINTARWTVARTVQDGRFVTTGQNSWDTAHFYSANQFFARGSAFEARVDTSSTSPSHAMIGFRNQDNTSGSYTRLVYAIYFDNGNMAVYEYGNYRGTFGTYTRGTSYDVRIETKPGAGAIYYLRPSGVPGPFVRLYESSNYGDQSFGIGGSVYAGEFGFDDLKTQQTLPFRDVNTSIFPGGVITLEVMDHALQANTTTTTITPVIGAPPVALLHGPTNGAAGVALAFDGYNSADDHAIASYIWDFGDDSPVAVGPAVSHPYANAGIYTNTLTVLDYAGQSSTATLVVTITGGNLLACVPWRIIGGIEQPHEVYSGKTNTLKAVARGVPVPFTYIWDYGDGSGSVTNMVTNAVASGIYNLEARHTYVGGEGTPYYATATVILTNGTVLADTYPLVIRPKTLDTEMNVAIDEGLWYLHKTQNRYDIDTNNKAGNWTSVGHSIAPSASAVHAFAIQGHVITDDATQDPYVDTVQRGVNYLLTTLTTAAIGPQTYGDPDGNHNGIALSGNTGRPIYETGPLMDALVAAARPELVAPVGGANVRGRQYKDIMQDLVDMYAWGQHDGPTVGGAWRYSWNEHPDNSAAQWGAIGLIAARDIWGIPIPDWVIERNKVWLTYSKRTPGFGYTGNDAAGSGPSGVEASTPSALVQVALDGLTTTNALWIHGEEYLANNWSAIMTLNNVYANYAIAKSMRSALPQPVQLFAATGLDWMMDPVNGMARFTIDRQREDGSWTDYGRWIDTQLVTPWNIIILSSSLFQRGPVAVVNVRPNPSAIGYPVVFDARASYHQHPAYRVVEYRWDFDASNGVDFEHPDAIGPVVTNVYGALSTNTVTLQVSDNATPTLNAVASVPVRTTIPPYPPTADSGGPYVAAVGQDVHLNGSGSFTVDEASGNFIQSWNWETDFSIPLDFDDGVNGPLAVITNGFPTAGQRAIGLRVKNANSIVYPGFGLPDLTAEAFTTVFVYDRVITDLNGRPKANKIQLTWTKTGDYAVVMRSTLGPDRGFTEVGRTTSSYATFLDASVEYNVEYYYRILAYLNGRAEPLGISDPEFVVSRQRGLEDHPPRFLSTPIRVARAGQLYGETLDARDPENDPIQFAVLLGPTNLTVNPTNGLINFVPTAEQIGSHQLSFAATNAAGRDVLSYSVFVFPASNQPPVVKVNGPYAALTGERLQFSSAGTSDPDGNNLIFAWHFGDGQTSTNPNPTHTYAAAGNYLVTLFANDRFGGTASAKTTAQITRPNRDPVALVAKGPQFNLRLGEALTLDATESYDLDGDPLSFVWIWGDGTTNANAALIQPHAYAAPGSYSGSLQVRDSRNGSSSYSFTVLVGPANQPPVIVLQASTNTPFAGETVTFDATGTTDPENDPLTFEWDFGDRSKTTGSLVTHIFQDIAEFTVTLRVADGRGGMATNTLVISALNSPPVFTTAPLLLVKAGTPYVYSPGVTDVNGDNVTFNLESGPATLACDPTTGRLDWLPGTNDVGPNAVVLRATDARGASTDQSFSLIVTTPTGPEVDLEPTGIVMTNVTVDSETLALSGTVKVLLRNHGADPVPIPFTISVFVDVDFDGNYSTNTDRLLSFGVFPAGLAQGFIGTAELGLRGQALFKDAPLSVFVDSERVVPEFNENNNIKRSGFDVNTNDPPAVDLSASSLQVDRSGLPDSVHLTARLGNSGFVAVPANVRMAFYDGNPQSGGVLIGAVTNAATLAPGQFEDLGVDWNTPTIALHTVFVVADAANAYTEISEANNVFSTETDLSLNEVPLANAGADIIVYVGDYAVLNGRDSRDPENKPLSYVWALESIPIGSQVQLTDANTVQPYFQPDLPGKYTISLVVNDGVQSSTNIETVVVTAVDTNANNYPIISSKPTFQGMATVPYVYAVQASDPDGDALTYSLAQAPAGMTINPNTGLLQWTTTNTGTFFVQVNVFDARGAGIFQSWSLTILPYQNLAPKFTSTPVVTAAPTVAYTYDVNATDPNNDTITYALTVRPTGMDINASSGIITWTPSAGQLGGHAVTVTASDGKGGTSTQSFSVVVFTPGQDGPIVQPLADQTVVNPAAFAPIPLDVYVFDPNNTDSQITWTVSGNTNLTVTIDSNRVATITYSPGTLTSERVTFLATDPDGKSGYASALFTVRGADNLPVAALANLAEFDTTSITGGFFELRGTADDPDAIDSVAYRVVLYDGNGAQVANVTPLPVNLAGWHEGRVAAGGSLGTLDFTTVRNGGYTLMLEVRGGNLIASTTATIALDSELKVGQVQFSQQDVVIPAAHTMLAVTRTYDSLNPSTADFGYSWTYNVSDLGLTINEQRVQEQDLFGETFSLRTGGGRDVTLNMPDTGRRITFKYSLVQGGTFRLRAIWTPPPGIKASLVPTVSANQIALFGLRYWEAAPLETGLDGFDFPGFILTTEDGTQYRVDREYLGSHFIANDSAIGSYVDAYGKPYLTRITDETGDRTEFVRNGMALQGIDHYTGTNKTRSLIFQRDSQNRVTAVFGPDKLNAQGDPVKPADATYEYDGAGNLVRANRLRGTADGTNAPDYSTVNYIYGHARFPHYITEIRDDRGVSPLRMEYDDRGRLVATIDAYGRRSLVQHDTDARSETVFDRQGNATVLSYDERGNIVARTDPLGRTTRYTYNSSGKETSITDPLGNTTAFEYDSSDNLTARIDALGNRTSYAYDAKGRVTSTTNPLGHTSTNAFDAKGNIQRSTNPLGFSTEYRYDEKGRLANLVNALGQTNMQAQYDAKDNITAVTTASGQMMAFGYDARGNPTSRESRWVNPNNSNDVRVVSTHTEYDASGQPTRNVDVYGQETSTALDESGKVAQTRDAQGRIIAYTYDLLGNLIETRFPDDSVTRNVFNENGRILVAVDRQFTGQSANGTYYIYDAAGQVTAQQRLSNVVVQVTSTTNSGGVISTSRFVSSGGVIASKGLTYDAAGRVIATTNFSGQVTRFEYDAAGRNTARIDPSGYRTEFEYDAAGRQTLVRDALSREVHYLYDALNRRVQTIFPDGSSLRTTYDAAGRRLSEVNQLGKAKGFIYDEVGRVKAVTLPEVPDPEAPNSLTQPRTEFEFDAYSNLAVTRDANGHETKFAYDEFNRQTARTLPLGQVQTTLYDSLGRISRQSDFKGQVTEFGYDAYGRVTSRKLFAAGANTPGETVLVTYDSVGRLETITDARGVIRYHYNPQNGISQITTPEGNLYYDYDPIGRRIRTATDNSDTRYGYDSYGRLGTVTVIKRHGQTLPTAETTTYTYDIIGRRASTTLPNGVTTSYQYDNLDRLTTLTHSNVFSGTYTAYRYTRNANGQKTTTTEVKGVGNSASTTNFFSYAYDGMNRLVAETNRFNGTNAFRAQYTYDLTGNRLTRQVVVGNQQLTTFYTYDANDRLLMESNFVAAVSGRGTAGMAPVPLPDGKGTVQLQARPQPAALSYWLNESGPYLLVFALIAPVALVSRRQWRRLRLISISLCPQRALFSRCVSGFLIAVTVGMGLDTRAVANEAALYAALSTTNWSSDGLVIQYEYDANGSVTKKTTSGAKSEVVAYNYNLDNRMVAATTTSTNGGSAVVSTARYAYNDHGIKVRAENSVTINGISSGSTTNLYLINPLNHTGFAQILEELPAPGAVSTAAYTIGDDVIAQATAAGTDYFLYDGQGSTRQLANLGGDISDEYGYDAYGMLIGGNPKQEQPSRTSLLYAGEQFDPGLQQYNLRARNYDPSNGRFTTMDAFPGSPDDPQSLHKYAYAHDDPANNVDPSGYFTLGQTMAALAVFSIVLSIAIVPLLSVLTSGKILPDAAIVGLNFFLPPYIGSGTLAAIIGVLGTLALGGTPLPILGGLQAAGVNVVGMLQRAVTFLNSTSGFGLSLSFEAVADVQDKSLTGWVAIGPALGIGSGPSFSGTAYVGAVWNTNQYEDYAGAFWGAGYGLGEVVSYSTSVFAGSGFTQWGVAAGVSFGSSIPISGSVSWTYYYLIAAQRPASNSAIEDTISMLFRTPTTAFWAGWLVRKLYHNRPVALDPNKHVTPLTEDPIKAVFGYPPD